MATKSMAYDHPAYTTPVFVAAGTIAAAVNSVTQRFAVYTPMYIKSMQCSVVTAGGTVNVIDLIRQAAGGTALTTMASIASTIGTNVGGLTINALMTSTVGAMVQGDMLWAAKGSADGVGVYAIGIELVTVPGAAVTV